MPQNPVLKLQTGTLYASGEASTFKGTGGPYGFSPFTSQFGGLVSSAGLLAEPFDDTVYEVAQGDEVIFVIAVQDMTPGAPAYDVRVRSPMPPGFALPPEGTNLTVTDGAGTDLAFTGDLFSAAGLQVTAPLAGYDANSGANLALITYALKAAPTLPGPYATVTDTATIIHAASSRGGPDVSPPTQVAASTVVVTAAPSPLVTPETDPAAVAKGQTIAFDVTIPVPAGTLRDLRLDTVLSGASASLSLVSARVLSTGSQLTLGTPRVEGGSVLFGTVASAGASTAAADAATSASVVVQLVARADGTASGNATLDAVVSALDASGTGARWTADVASTVGVVVPPGGATVTGVAPTQAVTSTMSLRPFATLKIADAAPEGIGTLAVTVQDASLGTFKAGMLGSVLNGGSTFFAIGPIAALQEAAQHLVFTASQAGTARFNLTVVNGAGGVAQNTDTAVAVTPSVDAAHSLAHNAPSTQVTLHVTTPAGQMTVAEGETYAGPVNYLQAQYIYDSAAPATIMADAPGVYIHNLVANAAIAVQSGRNVVDAGLGSSFLIGGSGTDSFFMDARGATPSWNTIANFHAGDVATIFGYRPGTSAYAWVDGAGAPGYTGRTLRLDTAGNGQVGANLTFAGTNKVISDGFVITSGQAGGVGYLTIAAR